MSLNDGNISGHWSVLSENLIQDMSVLDNITTLIRIAFGQVSNILT